MTQIDEAISNATRELHIGWMTALDTLCAEALRLVDFDTSRVARSSGESGGLATTVFIDGKPWKRLEAANTERAIEIRVVDLSGGVQ